MKNLSKLFVVFFVTCLISCNQEDDNPLTPDTEGFEELESKWMRIALWDEDGAINLLNPLESQVVKPDLDRFSGGSSNYVSSSGRYIISLERQDGRVLIFDTGIENHGDHAHVHGPSWLSVVAEAPLPTHFDASHGNIIIFNDGDGSVTWIRDQLLETPSFRPAIILPANTNAHHGAAAWLSGNKLAVTFQDPEASGSLPQYVKILDGNGEILYENQDVKVTGIHGDASNGKYALFGGTEGVIVASQDNTLKLIPNVSPLDPSSGNWMGTLRGHDQLEVFYGLARNHGVFKIDPEAETIQSIYSGDDVHAYLISADGGHLVVQRTDGNVKVFNARTGVELGSHSILASLRGNPSARKQLTDLEIYRLMDEENPILTLSEAFMYVLEPERDKISIRDITTMEKVKEIETPDHITQILRVGF
ncbi:hypothetical protein [Negadavirga shengliensis]|uniref:Uncharacterized protein n=1 Tax=Negadavirga shengliensis TaxID=1389218 RepID=A0ABV9T1S3_9BACT